MALCVTTAPRTRCQDKSCFECAADFDCSDKFVDRRPFCVFLPVAAGSNEVACPPNQACVCRECRGDGDCPTARPRCQTGTGMANPQLTGGNGGHDLSAHTLAREGVRLLGRLRGIREGKATFAADLAAAVAWGDEQARTVLRGIDEPIDEQGLEAPTEDWPRDLAAAEPFIQEAPGDLDLAPAGVGTVVWATGYRPDLSWVRLPFLDAEGYPIQRRGVTGVPGLYILGLDWLHTAKSGLFAGIGEDAAYLAEEMAGYRVDR